MENGEKKKSKAGIIILIIILLLLIGFAIWWFFIRDKDKPSDNPTGSTTSDTGSATEGSAPGSDTTDNARVVEYDYKDGTLTPFLGEDGKPAQEEFVIKGVILAGNRHEYAGLEAGAEGIMKKLVEEGYKTSGINSSFFLNEYIEFYIDTDYTGTEDNVKIMVTPHKTAEEYEKMSFAALKELAETNGGFVMDYRKPDEGNNKFVGENYVNIDFPEGKYDVIFTYKEKPAYYICLTVTKEIAK